MVLLRQKQDLELTNQNFQTVSFLIQPQGGGVALGMLIFPNRECCYLNHQDVLNESLVTCPTQKYHLIFKKTATRNTLTK